MDICRQCFREKSADIGFTKVRFQFLARQSFPIPIDTPHNHILRHQKSNRQSTNLPPQPPLPHIHTAEITTLTASFSTYSTAKRAKKLTPSSRTVRIHEIHLRTQLDYGSVQWSNVSDELKNGVFDVFVNGRIDIGPACPVFRDCESH